jgi:hypothetical protein
MGLPVEFSTGVTLVVVALIIAIIIIIIIIIIDKYHPPLLLDFKLSFDCCRISLSPHRSYAQGDYQLLYNVLHYSDWSCVLNVNSVDSAVYNLTATVRKAISRAISYVRSKNPAFPHWFSNSLKLYIKKKNQYFRTYKK